MPMLSLGSTFFLPYLLIPSFPLLFRSHPICGSRQQGRSLEKKCCGLSSSSSSLYCFSSLEYIMTAHGFSDQIQSEIKKKLAITGFESMQEIVLLAKGFADRPEVFSEMLQSDFGFDALMAHRVRAVVMDAIETPSSLSASKTIPKRSLITPPNQSSGAQGHYGTTVIASEGTPFDSSQNITAALDKLDFDNEYREKSTKPLFKQVIVNAKAKQRKNGVFNEYGLPKNYANTYPQLASELDSFLDFMTKPSTLSQESPIRRATAEVYVRHTKQFLGWFVQNRITTCDDASVSVRDVIPTKDKETAEIFMEFLQWLRQNRSISVSYEANLLRGLIKFLKFRFARESEADPSYGGKSFDDIPLIRELRKLHRDANQRQGVAPRSSDENSKWLTWYEFLSTIQSLESILMQMMDQYETFDSSEDEKLKTNLARKIAIHLQHYLVLAILACVPDRQRTIRELEVGKSLVTEQDRWVIKHGPDDYKTGKTYGERPPLMLSAELVPWIDSFLSQWRQYLNPKTTKLFVQPRTGKSLTQDSVYQIVARNCYKYSGKKTNPHLLRDMIVTHVRDSDASEKQLEALALYMGHSIQMQRTSYDRRTLKRKVAPAVELLETVNNMNPIHFHES